MQEMPKKAPRYTCYVFAAWKSEISAKIIDN